jgi:polyhydroxyalkanoate synthase
LREGLSVYVADWLPPRAADTERGLNDYVNDDLRHAVECVRRLERVDRIALVGCCLGGFLAAVYAALRPEDVERLMVFALPFESRPPFAPAAAEYLASVYGNIPAWWIRAGLNARVPDRPHLSAFIAAELGEPELAETDDRPESSAVERALEIWFGSDMPFAGRLFGEVMGNAYGMGQFAASGLTVGDKHVALGEIRCPVLSVCAENDRLVPPHESASFVRHVGSKNATNLVFNCGHLGLMVSRAAHASLWPHVGRWLAGETADEDGHRAVVGA